METTPTHRISDMTAAVRAVLASIGIAVRYTVRRK
jgi:hypothetical protein